jgi:hypothetical protein
MVADMSDEVTRERRWTAQVVAALVEVVRAEVPEDERADVLDDMALALARAAESEIRSRRYVAHTGSPEVES